MATTAPTECGPSANQDVNQQSPILNTNNTWPCSACTYLNWIKASRCVKCNTSNKPPIAPSLQLQIPTKSDVAAPNNVINEQMKSLSICGSDPDLVAAVGNRSSPMGSQSNLSGSRTNLGAGARTSPVDNKCYPVNKWSCSVG